MNKLGRKYFAELMLLLMTLTWGGTFVIVKESLEDVSPLLFITLRFTIAASLLLLFLVIRKIKISKAALLPGIFLGVVVFLGFLFQTNGLRYTSATNSGFITGSLVVMIPFLQILIERKIPTRGAQIGILLVFLGILILSSGGNSITQFLSDLGSNFNFGDWLTLACAVFFALHVVLIDVYAKKFTVFEFVFVQLATVALLGIIFTSLFHVTAIEEIKLSITFDSLRGILYTAILATLINYALQTKYQKHVTPTKAGIIYSFEPIFAALFAFFLLNEKISNFGLVGCGLIFLGLITAEGYDSLFNKAENENGES